MGKTDYILDATQLNSFERCPRSWYYSFEKDLTLPRYHSSPFDIGSFFHELLKFYYTTIMKGQEDPLTVVLDNFLEVSKRWNIKNDDLKFYAERFGAYHAKYLMEYEKMEVIAVEKGFSYLLFENENYRYILEGQIDLICNLSEFGLCVIDHKTQSRDYSIFPQNHQVFNYLTFTSAEYFIYNYFGLQQTCNKNTFKREIFKPTPEQLYQWRCDVIKTFDNFRAAREKQGFERKRSGCEHRFGTCGYSRICGVTEDSKWFPIVIGGYNKKEEKWRAWS